MGDTPGTSRPRRRHDDRGLRRLLRENWYRDAWLLLITAIVLYSLWSIQNERWENVRRGCEADNMHYTQTVASLDRVIDQAPPDHRAQAEASRAATISLITALAPPHVDRHGRSTCNRVADVTVSRWP